MTIPLLHPVLFANPAKPLIDVITGLGLRENLKLCLDAGDFQSAATSAPDKWLDRSGGGYDFFLGSGTGADAADPTFSGSVGELRPSASWSSDAGDYFTYDTTNEAWMENLHKDNAVGTYAAWVYLGSTGAHELIADSSNALANVGILFRTAATTKFLRLRVFQGGGVSAALDQTGTVAVNDSAWAFVAFSITEATGANGLTFVVNGSSESFTSTYSSPSAAGATNTLHLCSRGDGTIPFPSGSRIGGVMMWEGTALTATHLNSIYQATRGRYSV